MPPTGQCGALQSNVSSIVLYFVGVERGFVMDSKGK